MQSLRNLLGSLAVPLLLLLALVAVAPPALAQSAPLAIQATFVDAPRATPVGLVDHRALDTVTIAWAVLSPTHPPLPEYSHMMRAKMKITKVELLGSSEQIHAAPVSKSGSYPADGSDEDNTFARFSPSGSLTLMIANPALLGRIKPGDTFYVDFTPAT